MPCWLKGNGEKFLNMYGLWEHFTYLLWTPFEKVAWGYIPVKGKKNSKKKKIRDPKNSFSSVKPWKETNFYKLEQKLRRLLEECLWDENENIFPDIKMNDHSDGNKYTCLSFLTGNNEGNLKP